MVGGVRIRKPKVGGISPHMHWRILIILFAIINLAVAGLSLYLYYQIGTGEIFTVSGRGDDTSATIDREKLSKTIEQFEARQETFEAVRAGSVGIVDPS